MRLYLDTNAIIYSIEGTSPFPPDAIHLATAIEHHADLFLTGDSELKRCRVVTVEVI